MTYEFNGKAYTVKDITRGERRMIAALYPSAFRHSGGETVLDGRGMHELCEATMRLSGLSEGELDGLSAMEENTLLLGLANEYATGLAGKGSGA